MATSVPPPPAGYTLIGVPPAIPPPPKGYTLIGAEPAQKPAAPPEVAEPQFYDPNSTVEPEEGEEYAYKPLPLDEALAAKAAGKPTGQYVDRQGRPAPARPSLTLPGSTGAMPQERPSMGIPASAYTQNLRPPTEQPAAPGTPASAYVTSLTPPAEAASIADRSMQPPGPARPPLPPGLMTPEAMAAQEPLRRSRTGQLYQSTPMGSMPLLDSTLAGPGTAIEGIERMAAPAEAVAQDIANPQPPAPGAPLLRSRTGQLYQEPNPRLTPELLKEGAAGLGGVISGAFETAQPLMVAGGVTAPVRTALGLAEYTAADKATQAGLKAAGVAPEYRQLAGQVVGAAAAGFGHAIANETIPWISEHVKVGGSFPVAKPFAEMSDKELIAQYNDVQEKAPKNAEWQREEIAKEVLNRTGARMARKIEAPGAQAAPPEPPPGYTLLPPEESELGTSQNLPSTEAGKREVSPPNALETQPEAEPSAKPTDNIRPEKQAPPAPNPPAPPPGYTLLPPENPEPPASNPQVAPEDAVNNPQPVNSEASKSAGASEPHKFSSTQANLPEHIAAPLQAFGATIPKDELDPEKGVETESHITVRYGNPGTDPEPIEKALEGKGPITATLGKASVFYDTKDGDVLKVDVESPDLHAANEAVGKAVEHTGETHPDYSPHATIAYLLPGEGEKYDGKDIPGVTGQTVTLPAVTFSSKDGQKTDIPLIGKGAAGAEDTGVQTPGHDRLPASMGPLPARTEESITDNESAPRGPQSTPSRLAPESFPFKGTAFGNPVQVLGHLDSFEPYKTDAANRGAAPSTEEFKVQHPDGSTSAMLGSSITVNGKPLTPAIPQQGRGQSPLEKLHTRTLAENPPVSNDTGKNEKPEPPVSKSQVAPEGSAPSGPAPGYVRVYRGEPSGGYAPATDKSEAGRWFTPKRETAKLYGKHVRYVDLPRSKFEELRAQSEEWNRIDPGAAAIKSGILLPSEHANRARPEQQGAPTRTASPEMPAQGTGAPPPTEVNPKPLTQADKIVANRQRIAELEAKLGVKPAGTSPALPHALKGAAPRYSYGPKQFTLEFKSDLDKAAYIAAQKVPSKHDRKYVDFVARNTGLKEAQIRTGGIAVRNSIKGIAKDAKPGVIQVPSHDHLLWNADKPDYAAATLFSRRAPGDQENPASARIPATVAGRRKTLSSEILTGPAYDANAPSHQKVLESRVRIYREEGRAPIVLVNRQGLATLAKHFEQDIDDAGPYPVHAWTMPVAAVKVGRQSLSHVGPTARDTSAIRGKLKTLLDAVNDATRDETGRAGALPLIVINPHPEITPEDLDAIIQEERAHLQQLQINGTFYDHLDTGEFFQNPVARKAAESLARKGYGQGDRDILAAEIGVRLMVPGMLHELGLTTEEGHDLAKLYNDGLIKHNGDRSHAIVNQIRNHFTAAQGRGRRDSERLRNEERQASRPRDALEGKPSEARYRGPEEGRGLIPNAASAPETAQSFPVRVGDREEARATGGRARFGDHFNPDNGAELFPDYSASPESRAKYRAQHVNTADAAQASPKDPSRIEPGGTEQASGPENRGSGGLVPHEQGPVSEAVSESRPAQQEVSTPEPDEEGPEQQTLFSRAMPGFYSQLQRTVEAKMPEKASPEHVLGIVNNPQSGVKPDERKWTDIDAWLKSQKGPVTKQQVLDYLKANEVRVEEVVHGQTVDKERIARADAELKAAQQDVAEQQAKTIPFKEGDRVATVGNAPSVGGYSYSTGKIYEAKKNAGGVLVWKLAGDFGGTRSGRSDKFVRELQEQAKHPWVTGVANNDPIVRAGGFGTRAIDLQRLIKAESEAESARANKAGTPTKFQKYKLPGGQNYREVLLTLPGRSLTERGYHSPHWDEPNIVAHIRMSDYTTADGKKVAVMLEDQSDWHEEGRKKGYSPDITAIKQEVEGRYGLKWDRASISALRAKGAPEDFLDRFDAAVKSTTGTVPPAPFSKSWHELVFRRMLRHAVEGAYDTLAWTTGEQQASLYDLAKAVDSIHYSPEEKRLWAVKDGGTVIDQKAEPAELPDYIGKELADRLLKAPTDEGTHDRQSLSDSGLKVGGEGMKGFYDQMLPQYAGKYVKKWGATLGETKLKGVTGKLHSIDITPSMRESVMQGQPLFARKPFNDPNQLNLFDSRATTVDDLQQPPAPKPATAFHLDPSQVDRLPEAPSPASQNATPQEAQAFWNGTQARETTLRGNPALYVNTPGMEVVLRRMGQLGQGESASHTLGLTLAPAEWNNILEEAKAAAKNPREGSFDQALVQVATAIDKLMTDGGTKPLIIVQAGTHVSDANLKRVAEEEVDHASQMQLPKGLQGLPIEIVDSPEGQIAAGELAKVGYSKLNPASPFYQRDRALIAAEIGARIMRTGRYRELGLTAQQARDLAKAYVVGLQQKHGAQADAIVEQIKDAIGKGETTPAQGPGEGRNQHEARPEGVARGGGSRAGPLPQPTVSGNQTEAPETRTSLAPARNGVRTDAASTPNPVAVFRARPKEVTIRPPAKGESRSVLTLASRGDDTPAVLQSRRIEKDEPKGNLSEMGAFQDRTVRNLSQLAKSGNDEVHANAVQMATSRAQSNALINAAAPAVDKALTKDGPTFKDLRRAIIESRLQGIRHMWEEEAYDMGILEDADLKPGEIQSNWMLHQLKQIGSEGPGAPPQSPAETAAALMQQGDFDGVRQFAGRIFDRTASRVARIMGPEEYQEITGNPHFQDGLAAYKKLLEKPIRENHLQNEGFLSKNLGPLNTYYPLIAMEEGGVKEGTRPGTQGVPYRKKKNIANEMATGVAEDYSSDMQDFGDRIAEAFRTNNQAQLVQAIYDSNLGHKLHQGDPAPDSITFHGVDYKAAVVETNMARDVVGPKGTTHVPANRMVIPAWLENELRPILDKKNLDVIDHEGAAANIIAKITQVTLAGPTDAAFHSANLLGTLVANTPFLGRNLAEKAVGNFPFTKRVSAMFQAATTNPTTEEAAADIQEMAKLGVLPEKYGSMASAWFKSGQQHAELTGAKLSYGFGPFLYGPKGVDVRARLMMYRLAKSINPDAPPKEMYGFVNQLGNYTRALQGTIERAVKSSGFSPFYTAGSTMVRNSANAFTGMGPTITPPGGGGNADGNEAPPKGGMPKGWKGRLAMRSLQLATAGAPAMIALWMLAHKKYRGQWPQQDPHSKFLKVMLNPEDRASKLAIALCGPVSKGDCYVDMGWFSPLVARGGRALGVDGWYNTAQGGGSFDQKMDSAIAGMFNAVTQPLVGPPAKAILTGLAGVEPHLTGWKDDRGKFAPQAIAAVKPQPPGAAGWAKQHILAPLISMNSMVNNLAAATGLSKGLMPNADDEANRWLRMAVDMAFPQAVSHPSDTLNHAEFLARQRNAEKEAPRVELKRQITDAIRDKDMPKARSLVQAGLQAGKITPDDLKEAVKRATVPASIAQFNSLPLGAAVEVMQVASPEERIQFMKPLYQKLRRELPKLPVAERESVVQELVAAHITSAELQASRQ